MTRYTLSLRNNYKELFNITYFYIKRMLIAENVAASPGLEPRTKESESLVLPITP
jgi:hypothetical protein